MDVQKKIQHKSATIAIIGLGYVGLPLAVAFGQKGFKVIGVDRDPERIFFLQQGKSYIEDVKETELAALVYQRILSPTTGYEGLPEADAVILCLPTPLNKSRDPDLSLLMAALYTVARHLRPGQLIVLESTSFPGTTEEIALKILSENGYQVGKDFFLAYSPERIDPGNPIYTLENIPKVVSGLTPRCTELAALLYSQVVNRVVVVSSPRVAEMVKLLENTFRSVNIALINELAMVAHRLEVDIWETIEAASTKPFGFMPFYPGPGVGGHCLPVDPMYLVWKAGNCKFYPKLVNLANQINREVPAYVTERIIDLLNKQNRTIESAKVLILGVTYKKDVADLRESPALEIISMLLAKGALVSFHDPYISDLQLLDHHLSCIPLTAETVSSQDCVVIVADHSLYDYTWLVKHAKLIFDTRNATAPVVGTLNKVYRL